MFLTTNPFCYFLLLLHLPLFVKFSYFSFIFFFTAHTVCRMTEFQCKNKVCIDALYVCDHDNDCTDGSDEAPHTLCSKSFYLPNKLFKLATFYELYILIYLTS